MKYQAAATVVGIIIQLLGAAYLVYQSGFTARKLANYKSNVTYDNFASAIDALASEVHGQFGQQLRAFTAIALGSLLQLYGAIPA